MEECSLPNDSYAKKGLEKINGYWKHKSAVVDSDEIGEGTIIWHFAHVREDSIIGENCSIGKDAYIDVGVRIENKVRIQNSVSIFHEAIIEDDVFIGPSVIFANDRYPRAFNSNYPIGRTHVMKGASLGAKSILLGKTNGDYLKIGEYALIGAGSFVDEDIQPFSLAFGFPARQKGYICSCGNKLTRYNETNKSNIGITCEVCKRQINIK